MREIKFRAWDKVNKEMYEVGYIDFPSKKVQLASIHDGICYKAFEADLKDVELRQYTGLKDKNDNEIYEGDLDSDDYKNLSVICYIEKYGAYCAVPLELYLHEDYENEVVYEYGYDCYFHNVTPKKYLNIIGNIYENSQLLKGDGEQMGQVEHGTFEVTQLLAEAKENEENGN